MTPHEWLDAAIQRAKYLHGTLTDADCERLFKELCRRIVEQKAQPEPPR